VSVDVIGSCTFFELSLEAPPFATVIVSVDHQVSGEEQCTTYDDRKHRSFRLRTEGVTDLLEQAFHRSTDSPCFARRQCMMRERIAVFPRHVPGRVAKDSCRLWRTTSRDDSAQQNRMTPDVTELFGRRLAERIGRNGLLSAAEFARLALDLFHLHYDQVLPYRRFCERQGLTPERVGNWTRIPSVPAAAFKEFELTSLPVEERSTVFHSSGTTLQTPSQHHHSRSSLALYKGLVLPWFKIHLLPDRDRIPVISLIPSTTDAPHSSLAHMMDSVMHSCGTSDSQSLGRVSDDGSWALDLGGTVGRLHQQCTLGEPCLLAGTAYGFVHLLDHLEAVNQQLRMPNGSRLMETGGYKGRSRELKKAELHRRLSGRLGVPDSCMVSEYGMSELGSQAYDRRVGNKDPRVFQFPPWCKVRVLEPGSTRSPATGSPGLVTLVDLANVRSVLAVQTEDLGVANGEGFEYVGRARSAEPRGCSRMHA